MESAARTVDDAPAEENHAVGEQAERDCGIDICTDGRQRNGFSAFCNDLQPKQLKAGAAEDVNAGAEAIGADKALMSGAVLPSELFKQLCERLNAVLQLSRDDLEMRNDKQPQKQREKEQGSRQNQPGEHGGVDGEEAEEIDLVALMQNGIPHELTDRFFFSAADQNAADGEHHADKPDHREKNALFRESLFCCFFFGVQGCMLPFQGMRDTRCRIPFPIPRLLYPFRQKNKGINYG